MALLRKRRFARTASGEYAVRLRPEERALLGSLPEQLAALVAAGRSEAHFIMLNTGKPPLNDPVLRQALAYAIRAKLAAWDSGKP